MVGKSDILQHAAEGTLHRFIVDNYERTNEDDDATIHNLAIALHNSGEIDLLAAITSADLSETGGTNFFTLQQFYCTVIPKIEADPLGLIAAIDTLVKAGGNDLASNQPNAAYRDWCAAQNDRPEIVLQLINAGEPAARSYLCFALEAGALSDPAGFIQKAIDYMTSAPNLRLGAMTALSRIDSSSHTDLAHEAIASIETMIGSNADDLLRTHALVTAVGLYVRSTAALHDAAIKVMTKALEGHGDGVLDRSASVLFQHRCHLSDDMIELLLTALEHLNPKNMGTLDTLDVALSELIRTGKGQRVSAFLENVLLQHPRDLSLKTFDSVGHTLLRDDQTLCEDMAVRWLLSGERHLADSISTLMGSVGGKPFTFSVDIRPYGLTDREALFLARKVVGWFFFHPVTASSLVICILRTVKDKTAETIGDLLFEPLLLNYSGELKTYLGSCLKVPRDKAKPQIHRALGKLDSYLDDLQAVGYVRELEPSERERMIEQQRHNERMRRIQKDAEKHSVLLSIIPKSVILHGNGSASYRRRSDGKLDRFTIKMGGYSSTWEIPRLQAIDPFGLEIELASFRGEELAR